MKIVHLLKGKANPHTMNGVNKVVHYLASAQQQSGRDVEVWGITGSTTMVSHAHQYTLRLFRAHSARFCLDSALIREIEMHRDATVFHLHSVFLPELFAVSRELYKRQIPWVFSPHGGYAKPGLQKNRLAKFIYWGLFENKVARRARAVHCIGEFGEAERMEELGVTRFAVIPNGCAPSLKYKSTYARDGALRLAYCGRLAINHKGLDILLKAIAATVEHGVKVELDMVGDGPDAEKVAQLIRQLGLLEIVRCHGMQLGMARDDVLMECDAFVHASRWDGIPTAALEAASLGIPLIISRQTNLGDFVARWNSGFVLHANTPDELAAVLRRAADEKHCQTLALKGQAARAMIESEFQWSAVASRMSQLLYSDSTPNQIP